MYSRTDYENDLTWLDAQRAEGSRLLIAGKINGFQLVGLDREIDDAERACKNKLAGVRMAIGDRETMIKSGRMMYWKHSKGQLILKAHGKDQKWRTTTQAEIDRLRAAGYFLIELKGFPPRDGVASTPEAELAPLPPSISKRGAKILERAMEYLDKLYYDQMLTHGSWLASTELMNRIAA
jgi:hypothetical protein